MTTFQDCLTAYFFHFRYVNNKMHTRTCTCVHSCVYVVCMCAYLIARFGVMFTQNIYFTSKEHRLKINLTRFCWLRRMLMRSDLYCIYFFVIYWSLTRIYYLQRELYVQIFLIILNVYLWLFILYIIKSSWKEGVQESDGR